MSGKVKILVVVIAVTSWTLQVLAEPEIVAMTGALATGSAETATELDVVIIVVLEGVTDAAGPDAEPEAASDEAAPDDATAGAEECDDEPDEPAAAAEEATPDAAAPEDAGAADDATAATETVAELGATAPDMDCRATRCGWRYKGLAAVKPAKRRARAFTEGPMVGEDIASERSRVNERDLCCAMMRCC